MAALPCAGTSDGSVSTVSVLANGVVSDVEPDGGMITMLVVRGTLTTR
jgi:hypothetical protein